jgi:glutamate-1-semialdehyde 2,1-aminomutase
MNTDALDVVAERGRELQSAIAEVLERAGRPFVISGHPALFNFWFSEKPPREWRDWLFSDHSFYGKVAEGLIQRGVMPEPDAREPWYMSAAHSTQDILETANALEDSVREAMRR